MEIEINGLKLKTNDESSQEDAEFNAAFRVLNGTLAADKKTKDQAAKIVACQATRSGDRLKISLFLAYFSECVENKQPVPHEFLSELSRVFDVFRAGLGMDDAFGISKKTRGRPKSYATREWARTNANIVTHFVNAGDSLEIAIEKTTQLRGGSESQIKRDYLKFRKLIN